MTNENPADCKTIPVQKTVKKISEKSAAIKTSIASKKTDLEKSIALKKEELEKKNQELKEKKAQFKKEVRVEFRKQVVTGVTAAFAFIIALVWREPIERVIKLIIPWFGIPQGSIVHLVFTAILITVFAAWCLVFLSRWVAKAE